MSANLHPLQQATVDLVAACLPDPRLRASFDGPRMRPHGLQLAWRGRGLLVLADVGQRGDGSPAGTASWYHVSFSRTGRMPTYDDAALVRRAFFRPASVVVQVFPPESEHVNDHPYCLHLWERLNPPRLIPDLRVWAGAGPNMDPADLTI